MRTQYIREKGKIRRRKSGQGVEDVYEPKWIYFKSIEFLDDFVVAKPSQSNLKVHNYIILFCQCTEPWSELK